MEVNTEFALSDRRAREQERLFGDLAVLLTGDGAIAVRSSEEEAVARAAYSGIDRWIKDTEEELEEALKPLKEAVKAIGSRLRPPLAEADRRLRLIETALRAWKLDCDRKAAAEQTKLNEAQARKVDKAIAKGKDPSAVAPAQIVAAPQKTVSVGEEKQTWTDNWVWTLPGCDADALKKLQPNDPRARGLPPDCFVLDVASMTRLVKAGKGFNPWPQSGIVIANEPVLATRR